MATTPIYPPDGTESVVVPVAPSPGVPLRPDYAPMDDAGNVRVPGPVFQRRAMDGVTYLTQPRFFIGPTPPDPALCTELDVWLDTSNT